MSKQKKSNKPPVEPQIIHPENKNLIHVSHSILLGVLLVISGLLVYPLLLPGYSRFIENIEGAHLVNARYILEHFGASWNNLWYFGFPVHLTYPPFVPYLIALVSYLFKLDVSYSYRLIVAFFVWLTPLSIYLFTYYLNNKKTTAFLAALMYILLPSVAYLFIPQIAGGPSIAGYPPYHWIVFSQFGEGPHLVSLFFAPLAVLFFIKSFRSPDIKNYILAAIFIALTGLSNLFGAYALIVIIVLVVLGKFAIYTFNFNYRRLFFIGLFAYGLTAFSYDFNFVQSILQSSYIHPENSIHLPPMLVVFLVVLFGILPLALFLRHKMMGSDNSFRWFLIGAWTFIFLAVGAVYYHTGFSLFSQPNRYLVEGQMGFVILLAMFLTRLLSHILTQYSGVKKYTLYTITKIAIFVLILVISYGYISRPYFIAQPNQMNHSSEYEIATWLNKNIDLSTGDRVYLTGTPAFWLNVFSDVPQIRGGADNAQPNPWWADASYQINKGEDPQLLKSWLKILNIKYILVNYPESGTHYVDYENYERFADFDLVTKFADGGFKLFNSPGYSPSLFNIIDPSSNPFYGRIDSKSNSEAINAFAKMIPDQKDDRLSYQIIDSDKYQVKFSNLKTNEKIIFKMNFDDRLQAVDQDGKTVKIESIGPNFVAITPNNLENSTITFTYGSNNSFMLGAGITIVTIVLLLWLLKTRQKKLID
ncbi:MAG: hypothetical protein ACOZAR_02460 [Patescibacteria group bacterium]